MSVQRLALSNILRNGSRLVILPHQSVNSQNEGEEDGSTSRLLDDIIPYVKNLNLGTQTPNCHFIPSLNYPFPFSFELVENSVKPFSNDHKLEKNSLKKVEKGQCKTVEVSCQTDISGDETNSSGVDRLNALTWELENKIGEELMENDMRVEAVRRFRNAAEHGNVDAMYNYADCLFDGIGVTSDKMEAFHYWNTAAERGHAASMYSVALCYLKGEGTEKKEESSQYWMKESAKRGDGDAAFYMAVHYMRLEKPHDARDYIITACKKEEYKNEICSWLSDKCLSDDCLAVLTKILGV
ncbi:unnamed protein product [Auanema sp. JU1783]|nr:unnamed protein product [Auanema sp. JU1783]